MHDSVSLRLRADAVARLYKLTNKHIVRGGAVGLAALVTWYISWKSGMDSGRQHNLFRVPFLVGIGFACLALTHIHFKWFHYFYCGRKVGVEPKATELYYREALQGQVRQSCQMLVKSEYQNYCAIVNGLCSRLIEQQGQLSCFFAYPFEEESILRMTALKRELEAKHHVVVMPTHDTFAELLVCKLCRGILSSRYLVAEAWMPNRNVFFEYGLAIGFSKRCWLLSRGQPDGNWMEKYPLLADTFCIRSNELTPMDVADRITRDSAFDTSRTSSTIERPLKVQGSPGSPRSWPRISAVFGPNDISLQSHGLDEGYHRIVDILMAHLRACSFKMARDVVAGGSHKMANLRSLIDSASAVCGLWVADTVEEHEEINSIVALLLGYALAKGKRILVFQHTPCGKSMIDLCGVVQPIQGPGHLAKICPAMIDKYLLHDMSMGITGST